MTTELQDSNGNTVEIDEGESCNVTTYLEFDGTAAFLLSEILTLLVTLYDKSSGSIINSVSDIDALNANSHRVDSNGLVTIELDASDNAIVSSSLAAEQVETHVVRLKWTWNDGSDTRTGIEEFEFQVKKLVTPS